MNAILADLQAEVWAMEPRRLEAFIAHVASLDTTVLAARPGTSDEMTATYRVENGRAVIPVSGVIMKTVPWIYKLFGIAAAGVDQVRFDLESALADDSAESIVLEVSSPGGTVCGVQQIADAIYAARDEKTISAHIEDIGASAAYWIASQAETISANRAAEVGSIGVYCVYVDSSEAAGEAGLKVHVIRSGEHKGVGIPGAAISDEQIAVEQEIVNGLAKMFVDAVARGRGAESKSIAKFATGRTWLADEAKESGLIDEVLNLDEALAGGLRIDSKKGETMGKQEPKATEAPDLEAVATEAATVATQGAVDRLKAMEAAFPNHGAFARSMWEQGKTVEQARAEHYGIVVNELAEMHAAVDKEKAAHAETAKELAELKGAVETTGTDGIEIEPSATGSSNPIVAYENFVKKLQAEGDQSPEATISKKFPQLEAAMVEAVNAAEAKQK